MKTYNDLRSSCYKNLHQKTFDQSYPCNIQEEKIEKSSIIADQEGKEQAGK